MSMEKFLQQRGLLNYIFFPLAVIYSLVVFLRQILYKIGLFKITQFDVPVVVVGNITAGGNGKTPVVIAVAQALQAQGIQVGIVSRGYKGNYKGIIEVTQRSQPEIVGDEPVLIAQETACPVFVSHKRVDAVKQLINKYNCQVILADDGLQHYAMGRALEIAVIDNQVGLGNGLFLPAGPLREMKSRLAQCDFILCKKTVNEKATCYDPRQIEFSLIPELFVDIASSKIVPLDFFVNQSVSVVTGIAKPKQFISTLQHHVGDIKKYIYPDHYSYKLNDLFEIPKPIITTSKDAVKLKQFNCEQTYALKVKVMFDGQGLEKIIKQIKNKMEQVDGC